MSAVASASASAAASDNAPAAFDADATLIDSGASGAELAGSPLWPEGAPDWASEAWLAFKSELRAASAGWEVWTDWYEARLAGDADDPPNEPLEIARATIPDEIWEQGPAAANAEIKRLIAAHDWAKNMPHKPRAKATTQIRDAEGLTNWLERQDAPKRGAFATIIAARAALRAVPTLTELPGDFGFTDQLILVFSTFRALTLPWCSSAHFAPVESLLKADAAADHSSFTKDLFAPHTVTASAAAFAAADTYAFALRERQSGSDGDKSAARASITAASRAADLSVSAYASLEMEEQALLWISVSSDVSALAAGRSTHDLSQDPLWPAEGVPLEASSHWSTLMTKLRSADENWYVWFDWYQRRIEGRTLRVGDDIERVYADVPLLLWSKGPKQVNRWIKDRITELLDRPATAELSASHSAPPVIPPSKPAALEPVFRAGRLTLPKNAAEATLSPQTIPAALKTLAQSMERLAGAAAEESNIDRRVAKRLHEIAGSIPRKRPNQTELFHLGHEFDELKAFSKVVSKSWPEPVAASFTATTLAFERTLRRFPKWVDFTREPPIEKVSAAEAQDISKVADTLSNVLREPENQIAVNSVLPDAIGTLSAQLTDAARRAETRPDPIELGNQLLAQDLLESLNNTLKRMAEGALTVVGGAGKAAKLAEEGRLLRERIWRRSRREPAQVLPKGGRGGRACRRQIVEEVAERDRCLCGGDRHRTDARIMAHRALPADVFVA